MNRTFSITLMAAAFAAAGLGASACCTARVNIMSKGKGQALAIANSQSESCAFEKAQEKAVDYCKKRRKRFILISEKSNYQGMDKTTKGVVSGIGAAVGKSVSLDSNEDYRVKLKFHCR